MEQRTRKRRSPLEKAMLVVTIGLVFILSLVAVSFTSVPVSASINVTNQTVLAIVNVTNTEPNITLVVVDDDNPNPAGEIDLVSNNVTVVTCNATVFDYNGALDVSPNLTNGTFYINSHSSRDAPDNNYLYRNESCGRCTQINATHTACDCRFAVQYNANGSNEWQCNMTVGDNGGTQHPNLKINLSDSAVSNTITVTNLLAISTPSILDYGNLSVTETSPEIIFNVTNVGNMDLNISLRGYGGLNETLGQNWSMLCVLGNISVGSQRYAFGTDNINETDFDSMDILRNVTDITNFTLPQRIDEVGHGAARNSTLWRLRVPLSVGGWCNGTIIFGAVDSYQ